MFGACLLWQSSLHSGRNRCATTGSELKAEFAPLRMLCQNWNELTAPGPQSRAHRDASKRATTMRYFKPISLLPVLLLSALGSSSALDLVQDGKPNIVIVAARPPASPEAATGPRGRKKPTAGPENDDIAAARLLADWIRKITDAEVPVTDSPAPGVPAIYVGQAACAAGLKLEDIQSPTREGVRILADDQRVLLAGQSAPATLKAVCRFLEELGCRYFMDGPLGEVFPRTNTLSVGRLTITEKPGLLFRNPKGPTWNGGLWKAWNGAGGEAISHQHAWGGYVSAALFKDHPEFFAMGPDGQRKAGRWLCTSNDELRRYFAERVIAAIRAGTKNPSLSPTDGRGYCQCAACKAQDDPKRLEPSSGAVSVSSRYVDFFDDVARRVAVACPDSVLSFYCYADYTQPPARTRPLSPNLCAVIAPIRYCRLHEIGHAGCPSREQQLSMVEGWAALASRLGYYNYMYNLADGTLPFFKFTACQKEFRYLKQKGLCMMTLEVLSNWHIYGPQIYLSLRLAYNPDADANALMDDYWLKFYGPKAAPFMKEYWMGLDAETSRLASHAGSFFGLQQIYTPEFLKRCGDLLAKAAEAARGQPRYAERVALHTEGWRSALEYRKVCAAMNRGDFSQAEAAYDRMLGRLRGLAEKGWANREYATAYLERFLGKAVQAGAAAVAPPNRLLQVLPDRWRFAFDERNQGVDLGWQAAGFDDAAWPWVSTLDKTLDAQGYDRNTFLWYRTQFRVPEKHGPLTLLFSEVDGVPEVFVNGAKAETAPARLTKTAEPAAAGTRLKARVPFEADITSLVRPGENTVALRVDHTQITDLALGGILRPVLLIEKPPLAPPRP